MSRKTIAVAGTYYEIEPTGDETPDTREARSRFEDYVARIARDEQAFDAAGFQELAEDAGLNARRIGGQAEESPLGRCDGLLAFTLFERHRDHLVDISVLDVLSTPEHYSRVFVGAKAWTEMLGYLSTLDHFEPVSSEELLIGGFLGRIGSTELYSDAYVVPEQQKLRNVMAVPQAKDAFP